MSLPFCWQVEKTSGSARFYIPGHNVRAALRKAIPLHCGVLLAFLFRPPLKAPRCDDLFASSFFDSADEWQPVMPDWSFRKLLDSSVAPTIVDAETPHRVEQVTWHC